MDNVLTIAGLTKYYGNGSAPALNNLFMNLQPGRIVGLLGPNGSGKTTLLKLVAGLLTTSTGSIQVCGKPVGPETKSLISYLPDRTYLRNNQKIKDQLDFFQDFYADFDRSIAESMLADLEVPTDRKLKTLSKGTKEKVQLVLVMSRRAKLYLLDEPIAGVDPVAREYILKTIISAYHPDASILISTHLIADVEQILDDYAFIWNGKVVEMGDVRALRQEREISLDDHFKEVFRCFPNS
jgi:ABC-2 type transport system ATP-binding protein